MYIYNYIYIYVLSSEVASVVSELNPEFPDLRRSLGSLKVASRYPQVASYLIIQDFPLLEEASVVSRQPQSNLR